MNVSDFIKDELNKYGLLDSVKEYVDSNYKIIPLLDSDIESVFKDHHISEYYSGNIMFGIQEIIKCNDDEIDECLILVKGRTLSLKDTDITINRIKERNAKAKVLFSCLNNNKNEITYIGLSTNK